MDSGADGYAFIDRKCAALIAKHRGFQKVPLDTTVPVADYQGRPGTPIDSALVGDLWIDGRMDRQAPMMEADLGPGQQMILGRIWAEWHGILLDPRHRRLHWPPDRARETGLVRIIEIPYSELLPKATNPTHQKDAQRRDRAIDQQIGRQQAQRAARPQVRILKRGQDAWPPTTYPTPQVTYPNPDAPHVARNVAREPICCGTHPNATLSIEESTQEAVEPRGPLRPGRRVCERALGGSQSQGPDQKGRSTPPPPPTRGPTWLEDTTDGYRQMEKALDERDDDPKPLLVEDELRATWEDVWHDDNPEATPVLDGKIKAALISAITTEKMLRRGSGHRHKLHGVGWVTINSINREIDARKREEGPLPDDDDETRERMRKVIDDHPYLEEFADVFSKKESNDLPPHRDYDHKIEVVPGHQLTTSPLYSLTMEQLEAMKKYLIDCLQRGLIEPSAAPFASPVLFVRKADGSWRFCVDYRKLNAGTVKNRYPLPLIDETLRQLGKAKIYTKLDIRQAFHRIRMDPASEELTTFRTRYGQFKYRVMPFGLCNGPATFQSFINAQVFDYLDDFLTVYVDDLIIYSDNEEEHTEHVKLVLAKLRKAGLQVDLKKCEFHTTQTKFLGFIVGIDGIRVDPEKVEAVTSWERPETVKGVQAFLGFCNFYRRFIDKYGRIARPLQKLTMKGKAFDWTPECEEAFVELKKQMSSTPLLVHYHPERETQMETDASGGVVAGVLSQKVDGEWRPVCFFSKTMSGPEGNYPIHDKELLAIVRGVEEWYPLLLGASSRVEVLTDHHALQYFMMKKLLNARQAGWAEFLAPLDFMIKYRPGKLNAAADALSRKSEDLTTQKAIQEDYRTLTLLPPQKVDPRIIDEMESQDQPGAASMVTCCALCVLDALQDPELSGFELIDAILKSNREAESLETFREVARKGQSDWQLREDGLLLKGSRLMVPGEGKLRTYLLAEVHNQLSTAHPGRNKMRALVKQQYFWPRMMSDIDQYVRNCLTCRRSHVPRDKPPGLLRPLEVPERPWQHVTMDFHSMPTDKYGFDQVFVVVDRLGKRCYSLPCHKTTTAKEMARLYYTHIWRNHGAPQSITSDRGPQFISAFWDEFCKILGIRVKLSTAEHAQTDGQTEIMNQYLDQRLRPFCNFFQDDWSELLPAMDFAQAVLPHESTGLSPMEVETGHLPRMSYDWEERTKKFATPREELSRTEAQGFVKRIEDAVQFAREGILRAQAAQKKQADKHRREATFEVGDKVMLSRGNWQTNRPSDKLDNPMSGPWTILAKKGYSYKLDLPETWKIHPVFAPDRLRKAPDDPLPGQELQLEPPIEVNGEHEWEVEKLLASRLNRGRLEYRAQWVGHDEDPVWYPAGNFKNSPHLLEAFHEEFPKAAGPPKRLAQWMKAYLEDLSEEDHDDDDLPVDALKDATRSRRRRAKQ